MDLLRSLPIGLYLEQPVTWLHRLDSRVKLAWLMTFLIAPILANPIWRLMLVGMLIILTLTAAIPFRVWKQQMGTAAAILRFSILPQRDRPRRTSFRTPTAHSRRRINLFATTSNPSRTTPKKNLVQSL